MVIAVAIRTLQLSYISTIGPSCRGTQLHDTALLDIDLNSSLVVFVMLRPEVSGYNHAVCCSIKNHATA